MTEFISTCSMPLAIVFLIAGFFFLVKGADVFVEGSSSIAKRFHVPKATYPYFFFDALALNDTL